MNSISCSELKDKLRNKEDIFLIDVREDFERNEFNIGGIHIPLTQISKNISSIPSNKPIIIYCKKGIRSVIAIQKIQDKLPSTIFYNLNGGMDAWKNEM
jgi:rhodanese-related sulfurtransferase